MVPKRKVHPAIKIAIALLLLAGLVVLVFRSANDARAEPYSISARHLSNWRLAADVAADAGGAVISLRPPAELPMNLFRQLFSRQMESMGTPSTPGIPLVLEQELAGQAGLSAEALLALAREAGLEGATVEPRCIAYKRISDPGVTRQIYYLVLQVAGFDRFRAAVAQRAGGSATFNPTALSPVLPLAAQPGFAGWLPLPADPQRDCIAPVTVE